MRDSTVEMERISKLGGTFDTSSNEVGPSETRRAPACKEVP